MKIFVTHSIPDNGIKMLKNEGHKVVVYSKNKAISRKELIKKVKGAHAILSTLNEKIDEQIFRSAGPQLKIVANYTVGFDNIDLKAAKKYNVMATNTPSPQTSEAVAEHAFGLMIALARKFRSGDIYMRSGKYKSWDPNLLLGHDLHDKVIGVVGLGRIGFAIAKRAVKGFRMKVLYTDVKANKDFEKEYGGVKVELSQLLKQSDYVTLHVPLLPSTRHLINSKNIRLMKKTAYLVNTSRGPVVDEKALVSALKKNLIAGAALDVFEYEPKLAPGLSKLENVILTPHIASATIETRQAMSKVAAENIIAALSGKTPSNLV